DADATSGGLAWSGIRVTLEKTGRRSVVATPAGVTEVDHEREIIETVSLKDALAAEKDGHPPAHANLPSMYPALKYPEHRWGMTIALDSCTGCGACVVACVAENNLPILGLAEIPTLPFPRTGPFLIPRDAPNAFAELARRQIAYGRSVNWLRV